MWVDPVRVPDARAHFEAKIAPKLGPLVGFEPAAGLCPLTNKEFMAMVQAMGERMGL